MIGDIVLICLLVTMVVCRQYALTRHAEHTDVIYTVNMDIMNMQQHMKVALIEGTPWIIGKQCQVCYKQCKKCKEYIGVGNGIEQTGEKEGNLQYLHGKYSNLTISSAKHEFLVVDRIDIAMPMLKFGKYMDGYLPLFSIFPTATIRMHPEPTLADDPPHSQPPIQLNKLLVNSIILDGLETPINRHAIFSLQHKQIILPQDVYRELNSSCPLSLNKLHNVIMHCNPPTQLLLTIDNHLLTIPFELLMSNCHKDSCTMNIKVNKNSHDIVLGEVIFRQYIVTFQKDGVGMEPLHKLGLLHYLYAFVMFMFKMLLVMSLVSLAISAYYNRRRVLKWMGKIGRTELRYEAVNEI